MTQDLSSREPPDDSKVQVMQDCLHKLLQFRKNGAVSSAVSEMLICKTSWSLIVEKHLLPSREKGPSSCNINRLNWCSSISNPYSFSTELSIEHTKKLIFFLLLFELEEVNNSIALHYLNNTTYLPLKSAQRPQIEFSHGSHLHHK